MSLKPAVNDGKLKNDCTHSAVCMWPNSLRTDECGLLPRSDNKPCFFEESFAALSGLCFNLKVIRGFFTVTGIEAPLIM